MSAELSKQVTQQDIQQYAEVTGDINPVHLDEEYATQTMLMVAPPTVCYQLVIFQP